MDKNVVKIDKVSMWIDGSCSGNPGPGGYAALIKVDTSKGPVEKMVGGSTRNTTSNQMEVFALEQGLLNLKYGCNVTVYSDSRNLIGWMSQGFKRNDGTIALFLSRIEELCKTSGHTLEFVKVKAHTGDLNNERVDTEAVRQRDIARTQ